MDACYSMLLPTHDNYIMHVTACFPVDLLHNLHYNILLLYSAYLHGWFLKCKCTVLLNQLLSSHGPNAVQPSLIISDMCTNAYS